jgi:hypothetical protein
MKKKTLSGFLTATFFVYASSLDEVAATGARGFRRQVNATVIDEKLTFSSVEIRTSSWKRQVPVSWYVFVLYDPYSRFTWQHNHRLLIPSF